MLSLNLPFLNDTQLQAKDLELARQLAEKQQKEEEEEGGSLSLSAIETKAAAKERQL